MKVEVFEEKVDILCLETREMLINEWIPECAEIIKEMRNHWSQMVPKKPEESFQRIEKFFSAIAAIMSMQVRSLVLKSLKHFYYSLLRYKVNFQTIHPKLFISIFTSLTGT